MAITTSDLLGAFPKGIILPWYIRAGAVPQGWAVCDGANGTPDLRNRFIMGVADIADVGNEGGRNTDSFAQDPSWHALSHTLTDAEIPIHSHRQQVKLHQGPEGLPDGNEYSPNGPTGSSNNWSWSGSPTGSAGGGEAHYHGLPDHDNRPRYVTILYIMKV